MCTCTIGVDFDNTAVSYDAVLYREARAQGFVPQDVIVSKRTIRDAIRQRPDGKREWQRLQALIYGPKIGEGALIPGVRGFFQSCRRRRIPISIVSHKTEYAGGDSASVNLRQAALRWMQQQRFFEPDGLGLSADDVYFESTRQEKVARIAALGCTHFIDDLEETFLEPGFPAHVHKILYGLQEGQGRDLPGMMRARSWQEIHAFFFPGTRP